MLDLLLCAGSNLFRVYLIYKFIQVFIEEKRPDRIKEIVAFGSFYIVNTGLFLLFHLIWVNFLCNVLGISLLITLYTKSWKTNLFVTSSIYIINIGCDIFATLLLIDYEDGSAHNQVCALIAVFLTFICELVTERIIKGRKNRNHIYHMAFTCVPICSIGLLQVLLVTHSITDQGLVITSFGILMINFLMFYLYSLILQSFAHQYEAEVLKQKVEIYSNQLRTTLKSEERVKALRHDMKHHMNELKIMASKNEVDKIKEYINSMEQFVQNPDEIISSGNLEIDSVLNYMLQKAKERLKTVEVKVQIPERLQHTFDVNVLLGNLLENAIEAAEKTEEKYLNFHMESQKGILLIEIENSYSQEVKIEQKKDGVVFLTTKKEKEQHGIGLKNVKSIVEKYDGIMEIETKEKQFCVKLLLYNIGKI